MSNLVDEINRYAGTDLIEDVEKLIALKSLTDFKLNLSFFNVTYKKIIVSFVVDDHINKSSFLLSLALPINYLIDDYYCKFLQLGNYHHITNVVMANNSPDEITMAKIRMKVASAVWVAYNMIEYLSKERPVSNRSTSGKQHYCYLLLEPEKFHIEWDE